MTGAVPLPPQGSPSLEALRWVEAASSPRPVTLGAPGTEVQATLLEAGPDGVVLQLADGRILTAAGDLPYDLGSLITFRLQQTLEGLLQLQPTEARPPEPQARLTGLFQGEGADLWQRLQEPEAAPGLAPLRELLQSLQPALGEPEAAFLEALQARLPSSGPTPGPGLAEALKAAGWPPEQAEAWAAHLGPGSGLSSGGSSTPLFAFAKPTVDLLRALGLPLELAMGEGVPGHAPLPEALARAQERLAKGLPQSLTQRALALLSLMPTSTDRLPAGHPLARLLQELLPELKRAYLAAGRGSSPGLDPRADPTGPQAWGAWLKGALEVLARPEASPAQATAHALQAKEGTALFQIPLPWPETPGTLEIWAEREPEAPGAEPVHRVLLALSFQRAGELRVGLQSGPGGVRAQVLAEPGKAAALEAALAETLGTPPPFPVQVRAMATLPPRPVALATGGLQALG